MAKEADTLGYWYNKESTYNAEWSEPDCYDPTSIADRRGMYSRKMMNLAEMHGTVEEVAKELFKLDHPDQLGDLDARERYVTPIVEQGMRYGKWFYMPWSNQLVQYPDREVWERLITARNREIMSVEEQQKIGKATILYAGLSVGWKVATAAAHMNMGDKVILADPDTLSPTNLNRIDAGMSEVGQRKIDIAGKHLSNLNPYVRQVHVSEGITPQNVELLLRHKPDLIFEHVDHLPTKILLRKIAQRERIPLIMATDVGDRSLIDVERYDLGDATAFLGQLNDDELAQLGRSGLPYEQTMKLISKIIGYENISVRMAQSMGQIGISLSGIAQLGTTASAGGAYAAVAGREILSRRSLASGRYALSPQDTMGVLPR